MRLLTCSLVMLLLALGTAAQGKTWEDKEHHISLEVDESANWRLEGSNPAEKHKLFFAATPGQPPSRAVMLAFFPAPPGRRSLNQQIREELEKRRKTEILQQGGSIAKLSERRMEIGGVPAWEWRFDIRMAGMKLKQVLRFFIANGNAYMLQGTAHNVDLGKDNPVFALMDSLKFTQKPQFEPADQPYVASRSGGIVDETSDAYQIGKLVGKIFFGVLVLVFFGFLARRASSKKKSPEKDG